MKKIKRDSIFSNLGETIVKYKPVTAPRLQPGDKEYRALPVYLSEDLIGWLDDTVRSIKKNGYRQVTRSAILRALIKATRGKSLNFADIMNEYELEIKIKSYDNPHNG